MTSTSPRTNSPQVRITHEDGERYPTITVNGQTLTRVISARWEADASSRPTVALEVDSPALDVIGDLTEVTVNHHDPGTNGRLALTILRKVKTAGIFIPGAGDLSVEEADLWSSIETRRDIRARAESLTGDH